MPEHRPVIAGQGDEHQIEIKNEHRSDSANKRGNPDILHFGTTDRMVQWRHDMGNTRKFGGATVNRPLVSLSAMPVAIVLIVLACSSPVVATENVAAGVLPQLEAPIQIESCYAFLRDTDVGNVDYYLGYSTVFHDADALARTAVAIRFRFDSYNQFNEHLGERYGTIEGEFSPGVTIDKAHAFGMPVPFWSDINIWNGIAAVICSVDTVKYDDGTIWKGDVDGDISAYIAAHHDRRTTGSDSSPSPPPVSNTLDAHEPYPVSPLWVGLGTSVNPVVHGHPKYCSMKGAALELWPWISPKCAAARTRWKHRT